MGNKENVGMELYKKAEIGNTARENVSGVDAKEQVEKLKQGNIERMWIIS